MILLDAAGLSASRPGRPLFTDVSVTVGSGDRLAVVGLNGCGKSTLLRQLAGLEEPEAGVVRRGRGARVVALPQTLDLGMTTLAEAAGGSWEVASILDRLGLGGRGGVPVGSLSGGELKRLVLAKALAEVGPSNESGRHVVLLLDEPTNHLDIDAIAWLEERLAAHRGALVLVSHDRHLLDRVTTRILELDRGRAHVHSGGYASYLEARAERVERSAKQEAVRRNLARSELAWLRRGAPARTRKAKARIDTATAIVEGRPEREAREGELDLSFGTKRLGDTVVELRGVGHRFGEGPWLFRGVDFVLDGRERLGVVGPNGVGKSTLLDVLAGRLVPAEGDVVVGSTVAVGMFDQRGRELDPAVRVEDAVAGPSRRPDWEDARFLERFWFDADAQRAPIAMLSGGERRRLQLVLTLRAKPNVLFLDEPTNDLDLDTLRVLEDELERWPGAVVVVSHDRAFLERTVSDVLVIDEDHPGRRLPGGYAAWETARRARRARGRAVATRSSVAAAKGAPREGRRRGEIQRRGARPARRSPSTLRHLIREAEKELATLEGMRGRLADDLVDAGADRDALASIGTELAAVEAQLADVEQRWLALAVEAETDHH
ncbi:MAG TPA: ABC-F family ATP-binding cassette domain-containing protein [Acidimicrobiales bacterium]|nr:ABC-F family ATP-binding cassette domain-containing protein [Acidimicrobiales bacterium]